jgi:hypothetical protein
MPSLSHIFIVATAPVMIAPPPLTAVYKSRNPFVGSNIPAFPTSTWRKWKKQEQPAERNTPEKEKQAQKSQRNRNPSVKGDYPIFVKPIIQHGRDETPPTHDKKSRGTIGHAKELVHKEPQETP